MAIYAPQIAPAVLMHWEFSKFGENGTTIFAKAVKPFMTIKATN